MILKLYFLIVDLKEKIDEIRKLKEEKVCKICIDEEISVVFLPCGHLACCLTCSVQLDKCPICRKRIEKQEKIYG